MSYLDIWIYNSRPRMKVFLCYFLIFITFFIFSDIMVYFYTKSLYQPMTSYEIMSQTPEITVSVAEASNTAGNIKGTVKNNTSGIIEDQYLKFEFYTPRNVDMGIKYLKIDYLEPNAVQDYEMGFKYDNIDSVKISVAEAEEIENATEVQLKIDPIYEPSGMIGGVISGKIFQK